MPWRECHKMDERLRFVASLLDGEKMAVLCREFEISRKTGSKIFSRYKDCGLEDLTDRSHARQLPFIAQRSARCTRSWIGTAWSSAGATESFAAKLLPMSPAVSVKVVVAHAETPCGFSTTDPTGVQLRVFRVHRCGQVLRAR